MAKEPLKTQENAKKLTQKWQKMIQKRHRNRPKTPKMTTTGHPPFHATPGPVEKSRWAVLALLAMAHLLFSTGLDNISIPSRPYLLSLMACHEGRVALSPVAYQAAVAFHEANTPPPWLSMKQTHHPHGYPLNIPSTPLRLPTRQFNIPPVIGG